MPKPTTMLDDLVRDLKVYKNTGGRLVRRLDARNARY